MKIELVTTAMKGDDGGIVPNRRCINIYDSHHVLSLILKLEEELRRYHRSLDYFVIQFDNREPCVRKEIRFSVYILGRKSRLVMAFYQQGFHLITGYW